MMEHCRSPWLAVVVVCALGAASCEDPPAREMGQAQGALDAARAAGAAVYAREQLETAEAVLARSRQAVEERDYRQALNFALDARDKAQTAAREAAGEQARMRTEADRTLREVEDELSRTRARLDEAFALGVGRTALEGPQAQLAKANEAVKAAHLAFEQSDYRQVVSNLSSVTALLTSVGSEIDAATSARAPRRPVRRNR